MTIAKSRKDWIVSVFGAIILGLAVNVIWEGIIWLVSLHFPYPHLEAIAIARLIGYLTSAFIGVFLGRELARRSIPVPLAGAKLRQSQTFVLEVEGTRPLDTENSDWRFFLTNCTTRTLQHVELYNIQSDLGAYLLGFKEVPVMLAGQRIQLTHEIFPRRLTERQSNERPILWDFANDITGEGRSSYIWYDIYIEYREAESDAVQSGDFVFVCFDLPQKKMKTDGAQYYLKDRLLRKH